jgi:hypothetical protein
MISSHNQSDGQTLLHALAGAQILQESTGESDNEANDSDEDDDNVQMGDEGTDEKDLFKGIYDKLTTLYKLRLDQ